MILPLKLLQLGSQSKVMIETKNGASYDGTLDATDTFMNIKLSDVIITTTDGQFSKTPFAFIRGTSVKNIVLQDELLAKAQEEIKE